MHHRALCRLQQSPTLTLVGPSSFTHLLQAAAGRAWTRRVSSFPVTSTKVAREQVHQGSSRSYGKTVQKPGIAPENIRKQGSATHEIHITRPGLEGEHFHTRDTNLTTSNTYTIDNTQHSASESSQEIDDALPPPDLITHGNAPKTCSSDPRLDRVKYKSLHSGAEAMPSPENKSPAPPKHSRLLLIPTSHQMLFDNLRHVAYFKRPNPSMLIDYHEAYPQFQSTRSFNFLIDLAIQHTKLYTAQRLFDAMARAGIRRDQLTRKLLVRWLVRTGHWEQAWAQATGLSPEEALDKPLRNGTAPLITKIPCSVWRELIFVPPRHPLRRQKEPYPSKYEGGKSVHLPSRKVVKDSAPGTEAVLRRQQLLACVQPVFERNSNWINPKMIKASIYHIVRGGRTAMAAELAKTYFSSLPFDISSEDIAECLDIIHLLLSADIESGNASLVAGRRLLLSLLKTHASLKPSSKTLWLLLATLRKTKKSGTAAWAVVKSFEKSWGPEMVDKKVERRVIKLAKKEGREDIVQKMLHGSPHEQ